MLEVLALMVSFHPLPKMTRSHANNFGSNKGEDLRGFLRTFLATQEAQADAQAHMQAQIVELLQRQPQVARQP